VQTQEFDVVVVGGGLVGSSLVAALAGAGLRVARVDATEEAPGICQDQAWDVRVFAISPGSEHFLTSIGAWPRDVTRIAPVRAMRVSGDAGGRIEFDARDAGAAHLASIVENRVLLAALCEQLSRQADLATFRGVAANVTCGNDFAELSLADGTQLRARLLVGADGARSWLREQSGIAASVRPYQQSAVVANFACSLPHRDVAWQWFRADGVLALLPLPGQRCSMVWSATQEVAAELMTLDAEKLAARVAEAAGETLGAMETITAPASFPLRLVQVEALIRPRLALVGDAAHNLHPLAGQGVNVGFRDARELARVLRERGACSDVGEYRLLRRYERARREDILAMTLATDGLQRLFGHSGRPLRWMRNGGLALVNQALPLKRLLIRQAFG